MSIKSGEWGFVLRILYTNVFRKELVRLAARTDNTFDDNAIRILDTLAGVK